MAGTRQAMPKKKIVWNVQTKHLFVYQTTRDYMPEHHNHVNSNFQNCHNTRIYKLQDKSKVIPLQA